mgnify:CR=1 FL=1
MPTLDVILSQTSTPLTPKEADFLAAANQEGGGESDQARRPRDSQAGWIPQPDTGLAPQPLRAQPHLVGRLAVARGDEAAQRDLQRVRAFLDILGGYGAWDEARQNA